MAATAEGAMAAGPGGGPLPRLGCQSPVTRKASFRRPNRRQPRMSTKAAISIYRPKEEVQSLWSSSDYRPEYIDGTDAAVTFVDAPGDRGIEIHVDLHKTAPGGK